MENIKKLGYTKEEYGDNYRSREVDTEIEDVIDKVNEIIDRLNEQPEEIYRSKEDMERTDYTDYPQETITENTPEEWEELETAVNIFKNRVNEIDEIGFKVNEERFVIKRDTSEEKPVVKENLTTEKPLGDTTEKWREDIKDAIENKTPYEINGMSKFEIVEWIVEEKLDKAREEGYERGRKEVTYIRLVI